MHLIFFDESKARREHKFYYLGALSIHEKNLLEIEARVNKLSQDVFGSSVLKKETEFHATDIFNANKAFAAMTDRSKRNDIIYELLNIVSSETIGRIDITINTSKLYNEKYASEYAFMFLCEKTNELMAREESLGLLIGDRDNDEVTHRCSTSLSQYRSTGTQYQLGRPITNLFESVHFTPSHLSRFLQLADAYTWYLQFSRRHNWGKAKYSHMFDALKERNIQLYPAKYKIWPQ